MTKYILHGGKIKGAKPLDDAFYREVTLGSIGKTKILLNYFSRKAGEYDVFAEIDKKRFMENSENKNLEFDIADPKKFRKQLQWCSAMYMMGGDTSLLMSLLLPTKNLRELFSEKIIAGSSAGANVLSNYYWSNQHSKIMEGLGILDIKVKAHFHAESKKEREVLEKLLAHKEDLPLITLPEYYSVVVYR